MISIFSDLCNPNLFSDLCNPNLFSDLLCPISRTGSKYKVKMILASYKTAYGVPLQIERCLFKHFVITSKITQVSSWFSNKSFFKIRVMTFCILICM